MKKIAIFASGNGSNVENIIKFFKTNKSIKIALVASNNPVAGALIRGKKNGVSTTVFDKKSLNNGAVLEMLRLKLSEDFESGAIKLNQKEILEERINALVKIQNRLTKFLPIVEKILH